MDIEFGIKSFSALFAIMNPFLALPLFLSITAKEDVKAQRIIATQTVFYCIIMATIVAIGGKQIIAFFGITIDQFKIAGGIILFGIALSMLNGKGADSHEGSDKEKQDMQNYESIAFYPLSFPLIIGPGTITTLIIYSHKAQNVSQDIAYGLALASVLLIMFVVLFFASSIGKILSTKIRIIITRLMGMILAAISVEMITTALLTIFPALGK